MIDVFPMHGPDLRDHPIKALSAWPALARRRGGDAAAGRAVGPEIGIRESQSGVRNGRFFDTGLVASGGLGQPEDPACLADDGLVDEAPVG